MNSHREMRDSIPYAYM